MRPLARLKRTINVIAFALIWLTACSSTGTPTPSLPANPTTGGPTTAAAPAQVATDTPAAPITTSLTINDFAQFKNWPVVDFNVGAPELAQAGNAVEANAFHRVYMNPAGKKRGDGYAIGTILVREAFTYGIGGKQLFTGPLALVAMLKRGGNFNPAGGGWEWYALAPNLAYISSRGADMANGQCNACHAQAQSQGGADFVFPHPRPYVATAADFAEYKTWTMISANAAPSAVLGQAHGGGAGQLHVYTRRPLANPDPASGYAGGTMLVAEVQQNSTILEITAMVKRPGAFNPLNGGWEWFRLDPSKLAIMARGADLPGEGCNACHSLARSPAYGKDYVFKQPNDPFN